MTILRAIQSADPIKLEFKVSFPENLLKVPGITGKFYYQSLFSRDFSEESFLEAARLAFTSFAEKIRKAQDDQTIT